jgi:hypothetical protein
MKAESVPTDCPDCGIALRLRALGGWRYSLLSKVLFAIAGVAAFLSFFYILELVRYPDIPLHTIIEGIIALSGMLVGFVAWKLPRVRDLHCHRCGWRSRI